MCYNGYRLKERAPQGVKVKTMKYTIRIVTNCGTYIYTTIASSDDEALDRVIIAFSIEHREVTITNVRITVKEKLVA